MQEWIIAVLSRWGYAGVFLLIALENVFPPIPSEVILAFGGFMVTVTRMNAFGVVSAATAGSMVGALVLYALGRRLGAERLTRLADRWGPRLRIRGRDLERAAARFSRHGEKAVFFCRMIPLARSLISVPAGLARMPLPRFLLLTALGSTLWNTVLVGAGILLGENWERILHTFGVYSTVTVAVLGLLGAFSVLALLLRRR